MTGIVGDLERMMHDMEDAAAHRPRPAAVAGGHAPRSPSVTSSRQRSPNRHALDQRAAGPAVEQRGARTATSRRWSTAHVVEAAPPDPDLAEGGACARPTDAANDFTLIEGIGPAIAHLLVNRGLTTWWSLAHADLSLLRSMLAEAGPKYQVHDPTTWPQQARFLANGDWDRFQRLVDALRDGYDSE